MICAICHHEHVKGIYCPTCFCSGHEMNEKAITEEELRKIYAQALDTKVRSTRPSWDLIWMEFAGRLSERSTCSRASVGCVVVSEDNSVVLGLGYNGSAKGLPNGCISDEPGKCGHLHAEINALIKTNYRDAAPKKVYLTLSPCLNCSIALVNAGVREVIYRDEYRDLSGVKLLTEAGIQVRRFDPARLPTRDLYLDKDR